MEALIRLIGDQAGRADRSVGDEGKLEKILHSLLSSPCNFTPLLHFILPAALQDVRAFAEIWINPRSDERDMPPGMGPGIHILLVIDAEGAGRFEAELFVHGRTVDVALYCPPGSETRFGGLHSGLAQATAGLAYRLGQVQLHPLEKPRSLMDVFKSLPYKRVGGDVRI